jgi:hypothetical protein
LGLGSSIISRTKIAKINEMVEEKSRDIQEDFD